MDLLANLPDVAMLLGEGVDLGRLTGETGLTLDWGTQNLLPDSSEKPDTEIPRAYDDGDDLGLELGDDGDFTSALDIERGRDRVEVPWQDDFVGSTSKLQDDDLGLDLGDDEPINNFALTEHAAGGDLDMTDYPGLNLGDDDTILDFAAQPGAGKGLESQFGKDLNDTSLYEPLPEESIHEVTQRIKRRKVIALDSNLELKNSQIRDQQNDRSKTMKPVSFLPRDPFLLALLAMQKSGGFVSSILGDARTFGWAPELRDVLSVSIIRKSGELKRKRDSGVSDMYLDDERPELDIPGDESGVIGGGLDAELSTAHGGRGMLEEELPSLHRYDDDDLDDGGPALSPSAAMGGDFDETTMPLLHPADAGPISQGTQHAVHLLRDHFGADAADSPGQRQKTSVLFQQLLPERSTSRSQATKMFFEVLVLATKDAVKVEQRVDTIGGPIRLRAKRGLWGDWAEQSAGGQIQEVLSGAED
jgi:cohesin complex subunit SCC1